MLLDKLNDTHTSDKSYWSMLKTLFDGKKIPLIPPIITNSKLISNFKEKANHFNAFFASQYTPISDNSMLPLVLAPATKSMSFRDQDILKIIHSLSINKARGYDDIFVRLLKICDSSIVKPLSIFSSTVCRVDLFLITGKSPILYHDLPKMLSYTSHFRKIVHSINVKYCFF